MHWGAVSSLRERTRKNRTPSADEIAELAKREGRTPQEVSQYFRQARNRAREAKVLGKFTEVSWKLIVHTTLTAYGVKYILLDQPWFWELGTCWSTYPAVPVSRAVYWYYMMEMGTYVHELISHFTEARRSDFWQMIIHHIATLVLISGSYIQALVPIGSLIMMVHDSADFLLELAKLFNYMCKARPWAQVVSLLVCTPLHSLLRSGTQQTLLVHTAWQITDNLFVAFAVAFFISRLIIFPFWCTWSAAFDPPKYTGHATSIKCLVVFLLVLQCLHIFWMYLIIRMALKMSKDGKAEKDTRSDEDSEEESDAHGAKPDGAGAVSHQSKRTKGD
jgi:hypothetical protein